MNKLNTAYVLDFDGTITAADLSTELARRFDARKFWEIEQAYRRREFGMKVWLKEISAVLPADLEMMISLALEQATLRPGFKEFLEYTRSEGASVYIASDGFGFYIEPILEAAGCLAYINRLYKNEAVAGVDGRLEILTVHAHISCPVCGNCKAAHVAALKQQGFKVIYTGDGTNDRFGASQADFVFARDRLADVLAEKEFPFTYWQDFYNLIGSARLENPDQKPNPLCNPWGSGFELK
ncbi:MAG: MtnX-like HAD-IB family phosphatase [Bacillota bacterium]